METRRFIPFALRIAAGFAVVTFLWLGMQWLHEAGHVVGGIVSGGDLDRVILTPWTFSRTDMNVDPHPLITAWSGPLIGSLAPLALFLPFRRSCLLRLFASFCLLANGAYLFFGSFGPIADAAVLMRRGSPWASLLLFGAAAMGAGAFLLRRTDSRRPWESLTRPEALTAAALAIAMAALGSIFFPDV